MEFPPLYAGLDPGMTGGLGLLSVDSEVQIVHPWPATERDVYELLAEYAPKIRLACLEVASARPGQGVSTTFTFGRSYGLLRGFLTALHIPFEDVSASHWTRVLGVRVKRGMLSYSQRKTMHRRTAQQWFPGLKLTHATADAILIAEYCRRQNVAPPLIAQMAREEQLVK